VLGELEYDDGELPAGFGACRGRRWSYSMALAGPAGMAIDEDIASKEMWTRGGCGGEGS